MLKRLGCVVMVGAAACGGVESNIDASVKKDAAIDARPIDAGIDAALCAAKPASLVSWWRAAGDATDSAGANQGSLVGGSYAAGEVGQAFRLSGTNQYVNVPDSSSLDIIAHITIEAWIYAEVVQNARIVDKITPGGADGYYFDIVGGKLRLGNGTDAVSSTGSITAQTWTHVAGTYDGSMLRVYINGVQDGSVASTAVIPANALALTIGASSTHTLGFNGNIDEVAVYSAAVSQPALAAIHAAGSHGKCP